MRIVAILLVALVISLPAAALTVGELRQYTNDYYRRDFGISWANDTINCPSNLCDVSLAFYDLHSPRFNGSNPPDFYNFASKLINYSDYTTAGNGDALAEAVGRADGHMRLYPNFFRVTRENRAGAVVHEAAHMKSDVPLHTTCDDGRSCDDIFYGGYEGGAYNYEFMYYGWIARGSNYTELDRGVAESLARATVNNKFRRHSQAALASWFPQSQRQPQQQVAQGFSAGDLASAIINSTFADIGRSMSAENYNYSSQTYRSGNSSITINQYFGGRGRR